jgi:hypothetical protein
VFRQLLVAFDGSAHAERALVEAIDLARASNGQLTVMSVVPDSSAAGLNFGYTVLGEFNELSDQVDREYVAMLDTTCHLRAPTTFPSTRSSRTAPRKPGPGARGPRRLTGRGDHAGGRRRERRR